jgi:7,8-dihydro-6-hydroxymethylpterin-pyrophosphokinase
MSERAFVLIPLAAIAPNLMHPIFKVTVAEMLDKVDSSGISEFSPEGCDEKQD